MSYFAALSYKVVFRNVSPDPESQLNFSSHSRTEFSDPSSPYEVHKGVLQMRTTVHTHTGQTPLSQRVFKKLDAEICLLL